MESDGYAPGVLGEDGKLTEVEEYEEHEGPPSATARCCPGAGVHQYGTMQGLSVDTAAWVARRAGTPRRPRTVMTAACSGTGLWKREACPIDVVFFSRPEEFIILHRF